MATQTESVAEEVQQEEVAQPQQEQPSEASSPDTQQEVSQKEDEKSKEYNFRQMREALAQRDEELRKLREQQKLSASQEEELGEEDLVEGKHLKKGLSEIKNFIRQKELETVPDKLRGKFDDFDQVVTKENLEKLEQTEPELFSSIRVQSVQGLDANELFNKGVAAYKTLKSLGYCPNSEEYMKQKQQVHSNHKKPMSAQAIKGSGALHEANMFANGLTPELKKQLQKEMSEAVKAR